MLRLLHIENIAVIERADIEFGACFNVLSGETGAGKSIVIDAINAVLGERTGKDIIRSGERSATVSALFNDLTDSASRWLEENGFEADEEGQLFIQRQISADGKNSCKINGRPVIVSILRQLGTLLVNIHGQHDSQQLLDDRSHMGYLDSFAGDAALLKQYSERFDSMQKTARDMDKLRMSDEEKAGRIDTLRYRVDEIEAAELSPGEEEELEYKRGIIKNSEKIAGAVEEGYCAMYGGESGDGEFSKGVYILLSEAEKAFSGIREIDEKFSSLHQRLEEIKYSAYDIAESIRDMREEYSFSVEDADYVEGRLDLINKLKRKYGSSVEEILESLEEYKNELDEIEFSELALDKLRQRYEKEREEAEELAEKLTEVREKAGRRLAEQICEELIQLDMKNVRLCISCGRKELSRDGRDEVSFLISANTGEEPRPLSRIASGGELARIMLAMKSVLSGGEDVATFVFDEVDSGVSGRAAQRVAEKLASTAKNKQVLCVTHLPQLAAMGDTHFLISKSEKDGRTFTSVEPLDGEGRAREVARIIGGESITELTVQNAAELIESAWKYKASL
ncbi:MAG: DNA repair protein RecN [Oscillospiraceae bacterium]|jgi:DNA repair protein RecN (Recombination protein N)|nr:DNA repair protein RecN [Oscillospiraceae bacterium]